MMKSRIIAIVILGLFSCLHLQAQDYNLRVANKLYERLAYTPAIEYYKKSLSKTDNYEAKVKLAESYRKINDVANADYWYSQVVSNVNATADQKLYYAQMLQQNGKYEEAKQWYSEYAKIKQDDSRGAAGIAACNELLSFYADSASYKVKIMPFNSDKSDIGTAYFEDGLVFASDRMPTILVKRTYEWTGDPFYNFYIVKKNGDSYGNPELLSTNVNSKYHDAIASFSKTQDVMWFTRDNFNNGKTQRSDDRTIKLKMYSQHKEDKSWSDAVEFIYNNNEYSTGHPSLSTDGQSLYFASDRPGGFGGVDIYVCKNELGRWSAPLNMGPEINTEGNEMFPYISSNNTLYYSSNGRKGLGGLDIYSSSNKDGQWSRPQNLGYPINTSKDDFGITTNETGEEGYFSSNRGSTDDIYSFRKECRIINVLVYEKGTNNPIEASDVKVVDKQSKEEVRVTDKEGQFTMCLTPGREYEFIANKADYKANSEKLNTLTLGAEKVIVRIPLEKPSAFALEGKVYSMDTKELMAGVKVTLFNYCNNKTEEIITGADGKYSFNLKPECKYKVTATKPDCGTQSIEKNTIGLKNSQTLYADFALLCKGQVIKIDNIYYDLDKYNIRPDAARELDKTLSVLNQYPTMKIELRSHTDCRAPDEYNKKLSQNRAQAAVNYLVTKGISSTRMKAAGYGEDIPVNGCVDGANCTEEQHQANRRTEFKILSF